MKLQMPITKEKIRTHLAYAWWQYALLLVAAIFGWNLLFTTTHYRSPAHLVVDWYYDGAAPQEAEKSIDGLMDELHASLFPDMEVVTFSPVLLDQTYGAMQLTIWVSAGEGDLFMLANENFQTIMNGGLMDLQPYIDDGTLNTEGLTLDKGYVMDSETGKKTLYGIPAENLPKLIPYGLRCEGEVLCVSATGGNIDHTVMLLAWLLENMR